jgi:hypothetical protein
MTVLQGPDRDYPVKITLGLVADLEKKYGSLYQIAEGLIAKNMPLSTIADMLKTVYRAAGCDTEEKTLDAFLVRQPCADIFAAFLLDILSPLENMGGVMLGERRPARKKESA